MTNSSLPSIYSVTKDELKAFLVTHNQSAHLAAKLFQIIYKKCNDHQISDQTWLILKEHFGFALPRIESVQKSDDGTVKFLMSFSDNRKVETVLIPFFKRYTVCLSTQVGCAMNCSFCFTGTQGLTRHLNCAEIIGQYLVAKEYLETHINQKAIIPNIVFMGQGEPLHNFDQVKKSLAIFTERSGIGLGPRQITLSTAGHLPGLLRFAELPKINLALSLHSGFDQTRSKLIPINQSYNLESVFAALDKIELLKRQFITYEYLLIDGLNDRDEDANQLATLLTNRPAIINLIPFNPFPGSHYQRPSREKVDAFKQKLVEHKLRVMIRTTKGSEILAACGQLNSAKATV